MVCIHFSKFQSVVNITIFHFYFDYSIEKYKNLGCLREKINFDKNLIFCRPFNFKIILEYAPHGATYDWAKSFSRNFFNSPKNNKANMVGHPVYSNAFLKNLVSSSAKELFSELSKYKLPQ